LAKLQRQTGLWRNQVTNTIIICWSIMAKCTRLAFKFPLSNSDYEDLEKDLKKK
ncbi:11775_t:CDS:1, partial [Dentiscutata heterogama]